MTSSVLREDADGWVPVGSPTPQPVRLSAVTRTQVLAFRRGLEADLAPNTGRQVMALLAGVFTDAVEDGFLAKSPCRDTLPPRPYREKVAPLTVEQVEALVAAAPIRYRALVVLGAGCGLAAGRSAGVEGASGAVSAARARCRRAADPGARLTAEARATEDPRQHPHGAHGRRGVGRVG